MQEGWFPSRSPAYTGGIYVRDSEYLLFFGRNILNRIFFFINFFVLTKAVAGKSSNSMNVVGVRAFVVLNFVGGIGLLIVILAALLSPNVRRLPTWYNFCASWVVSCVSYTLLTFGGQQAAPEPSHNLCSMQAALIYAVPPLLVILPRLADLSRWAD